MIHAKSTITIRRDPKEVFEYLSDVTSQSEWINEILESGFDLEGPVTVGTKFTQEIGIGSQRTLSAEFEVIELVENERIRFRSLRGLPPTRRTFSVDSDEGNTRVTYIEETDPPGIYFKLIAPLSKLYLQRRMKADLRSLREKLEGSEEANADDSS